MHTLTCLINKHTLINKQAGNFFSFITWKIACRVGRFVIYYMKNCYRVDFFFRNAKRACSFIRQVRVFRIFHLLFEASPRIRLNNEVSSNSLLLELRNLFVIFSILNMYNFKGFYQPGEIVCLLLPLLPAALILLLLSNNNAPGNQNR